MGRRVFYSFHYKPDNWRAAQVRNAGTVEGNRPVSDNEWESITKGGDVAIKKWINGQLEGRSCTAVLIGAATAGRKWINYEIEKSWADGKGVFGVHIHRLLNQDKEPSEKGTNPFDKVSVKIENRTKVLSEIVKVYDPPYTKSTDAYDYIKNHIDDWVEKAIEIRKKY